MPNYVEMIRLHEAGFSQREIDYFAVISPPFHDMESGSFQLESGDFRLESTKETGHESGLGFNSDLLHIL